MDKIRAHEKFAGAIMGDNQLSPATISAAGRHQPESAEEKAAPAAGRMRAGTASDEEHGRYSLRQRYAGGVVLQRHTEYRVHVTAA
jgi:hypothetical protein